MTEKNKIRGVIFDFDDTLLDNLPTSKLGGLHERSRLSAIHTSGHSENIPELLTVTVDENFMAFRNASEHTVEGAVWKIMFNKGLVPSEVIDKTHPLLKKIVDLKFELHEDVLRTFGVEVPGAVHFIQALADKGLHDHMAIASMGYLRDISIFLDMTKTHKHFPKHRIISREQVQHAKPHPESFDSAFTALKLSDNYRQYVLAFEDDPRGIESAHRAGLVTCAITTRYPREHFEKQSIVPDIIAGSFQEFEEVLGLSSTM